MDHLIRKAVTLMLTAMVSVSTWTEQAPLRACSLVLAPQTMPSGDGRPEGLASEVLALVGQRLAWTITVDYMPWPRVVAEAKAGRCDMVYTVLRRSDYEEYLVFPKEPVLMQSNVLLIRKGSRVRYQGDLEMFMRAHSVGLYHDKAVDERFEQLRRAPWARVDVAVDAERNLQKLLMGRFDAAIENELTALHQLRLLGAVDQVEVLQPPLNVVPAYAAFPRGGRLSGQTQRFDQAMAEVRGTVRYRSIVQKYLGTRGTP